MNKYNPQEIEKKWQEKWEKEGLYKAKDQPIGEKKYYILIEFPYPSGAGLHVGHARSWSAMDALSRKKRMENFNVLYPIGWDAFGLPAENYAIKTGIHPSITTAENIENSKRQIKSWGLSFDWDREINTSEPKYYKWTQWIFLKLLENDMAYQSDVSVNWCPFCKTNLANEEVMPDGTHERCGNMTEKRMQKQWLLRITKYAQKLLDGLKEVDYPDKVRIQQQNWIGKSEGTLIKFTIAEVACENFLVHDAGNSLKNLKASGANVHEENFASSPQFYIEVFTTRPDTIFGVTAIVVAPEHPIIASLLNSQFSISNFQLKEVKDYIGKAKGKSEIERLAIDKEKTGVFTGLYAVNPINNKKIPVWVGDYVLGWYGKGAVMMVPAHDKRDLDFAKKHGLEVKQVISDKKEEIRDGVYEEEGWLINSGEFDGQTSQEARKNISKWLEKNNSGSVSTQYKLRDWVFSRQHYWGEPIPVIHCEKCGIVAVPEDQLPVELPYLEKYQPSGTGKSPLEKAEEWVNTKCPKCGGPAKRETDTMPNWAGSNWYFLRYLDPKNDKEFASPEKMKYWMPVDIYQGGFEHTTLHLLYSRFIYRFLYDIKKVPTKEPYAKRRVHGIVLGPDGRKMSKSFGNVINPDQIVGKFGADTLRVYEAFMGPFDQTIAWSEEGVEGCFRFLKRVWQLSNEKIHNDKTSKELLSSLHKTVKKVSLDIENFKFNTAIASMMEFINNWQQDKNGLNKDDLKSFLLIVAPFAPHIAEEIWQKKFSTASNSKSIHQQSWPEFDPELLEEDEVNIIVQVNGKVRDVISCQKSEIRDQRIIEKRARMSEKVQSYLKDREVKKIIYVEGKIINFVIE